MTFKEIWTKHNATYRGLPRPYSATHDLIKIILAVKNLKIANKVPIPWQSFSRFDQNYSLGIIAEHEAEVVEKGTCAYCGLGFEKNDECTIWINYPEKSPAKLKARVFSDHFPFHLECMRETRVFCPHMQTTQDEEFKVGLYENLLQEAKDYLRLQSEG